eukprot:m.119101 g.119101  ORF g.119101 m.119101 type:complete len:180 (+) comp9354_c0_seq2:1199-1738(+)
MGSSKWRASSDASRAYTRCITIHTTYCVHNAFFQPFPSPTSGIACIHYHGDYIASGSSDKSIIIWEVKTGNIVRKLLGHSDLVRCVRFDEDFIVSGSYDTNIMVWNLHSGECMFAINGHSNRVFRVQFDKFRIVSSSQDDKIIKFDFSSGVSDMVLKRWSELRPHYRLEPLESNAQTTS